MDKNSFIKENLISFMEQLKSTETFSVMLWSAEPRIHSFIMFFLI